VKHLFDEVKVQSEEIRRIYSFIEGLKRKKIKEEILQSL